MNAKAIAKTVRMTPRKVRLVADLVRNKNVGEAQAILKLTQKAAAKEVLKVLNSAVANAAYEANLLKEENFSKENLYITDIQVTEGVRMKRFLPRAKGSASGLVKRTCHISVTVSDEQ